MSNPNLMSFRFTHSMNCVFTYLFTQYYEYGYMNYVEYSPQYTYEYHHHNHHFIIARLCSSSFLFSTPENQSLTANSSGLPSNSPNEFSFFRMNVFLLWRLSNWYWKRLLSMICFDRMFGDCIDVLDRIEIGICRIVDYCSLS